MPSPIAMPKPGQFTEECTIVKWLKKEGDKVAKGDILFEIETDKANMEVESFFEGTLLKILIPEGGTVPVQAVVAWVGQPGEAIPAAPPKVAAESPKTPVESAKPEATPAVTTAAPPPTAHRQAPTANVQPAAPQRLRISPRAKALAARSVINPAPIRGTGPAGRIVEKDVLAYLETKGYAQIKITPAAKALAATEKLDLLAIRGTGDDGKISVDDVQRAVAEKPKALSKMRQVIAQRLTQSFTSTPHFFVTVAVDMTDLIAYRATLKTRGLPYSVTDFIAMAVTLSLKEFPAVNSSTDGKSIGWHSKVQLGVAVSLESGLVVPVIHNADDLTLLELHDRSAALIEKARSGKLLPDEMSGSTFTISNMGMLNVENFTAIINPGEAAILAVSSTTKQPVVKEDKIVVRQMMKITLSSDHQIIDGATAVQFANAIRAKLENIELWKKLV